MGITIYFWGQLSEITGFEKLVLEEVPNSMAELSEKLFENYPELKSRTYAMSVNKKFCNSLETPLQLGDEVAFMPPFAGG